MLDRVTPRGRQRDEIATILRMLLREGPVVHGDLPAPEAKDAPAPQTADVPA
jgi:acetyl-CoA carboxylase carboxyl transferase subunit beta